MYPVLLAAGAAPTLASAQRGLTKLRTTCLVAALGLSAFVSAVLMLPLVPVAELHATPVPSINYDAGETVGWPLFADRLGAAVDALPAEGRSRAVVIGANYGEAGAIARYRPDLPTYGAQNSLWISDPLLPRPPRPSSSGIPAHNCVSGSPT